MFIFRACIKKVVALTFLILGFNFDLVFGPKREIYSICICFYTGMSTAICDLALYLQNKDSNIS